MQIYPRKCPRCKSRQYHETRLRSGDWPGPLIGIFPLRCNQCTDRFHALFSPLFILSRMFKKKRKA